jgi:hypothetical protein
MVNEEEVEFKAGALLKLKSSIEWHSAYFIDDHGRLGEDLRVGEGDILMYIETQINKFQPDVKRFKCLFGDRFILINGGALRPVQY